jgi:sensor c-di-GMP phosphodiesterase-like protein
VFVSGRLTPYWSHYFDEQTALKRPLKGFDWQARALVRTDYIPGTPWVVQSYLTLPDILQRQGLILVLVMVAASLIGLLVTAFMTPILARQKQIGARIRNLLEEGCVQCYYQPIVALATRRWVGCEVLMRIRDGNEQISPLLALPEIEKQGLGWALDSLVLQQSLRELAQALPPTPGFKVAVNLFPDNIHFQRLDALLSPLQALLGRPDLQLGLEIVEQSYDDTVVHEIAALRQAGYQISVDDFGTGYSNLGRVKRMAPDVLKIDRSFVFEMEDLSLRSSLIPEIVSIARAIGSSLVAEGIENELQAEQLACMGVEYGQGYLFARPLPIGEFVSAFAAQLRWQHGSQAQL